MFKKIIAAIAAAVTTASVMAVPAFAQPIGTSSDSVSKEYPIVDNSKNFSVYDFGEYEFYEKCKEEFGADKVFYTPSTPDSPVVVATPYVLPGFGENYAEYKFQIVRNSDQTYGYARVSSKEQNLDRQLEVLKQYVDERNIITDKQSGKDFERNGYQMLKSQLLRSGDTLYIKELDRLGRDYTQMKKEYAELIDRDINVVIIDTPLLSTADKSDLEKSLISSIVFELFAYLAEKERLKIRSRCAESIESAKKRGVKFGRPRIQNPDKWSKVYSEWREGNITATTALKLTGLKKNSFYRMVREEKERSRLDEFPSIFDTKD